MDEGRGATAGEPRRDQRGVRLVTSVLTLSDLLDAVEAQRAASSATAMLMDALMPSSDRNAPVGAGRRTGAP